MTEPTTDLDPPVAPSTPMPSGANRSGLLLFVLTAVLFLAPGLMLLHTAALPSARAAHAARHGLFQMDNEEGALLFQAMQIQRGESIYHPLDKPPYIAGTYTPLFMATVSAIDDFTVPGFTIGRMIVWGTALGAAMLLVLLAASVTRNAGAGLLAGVLFLATYETYRWIAYFRVDFPALFLSLAGLSIVVLGHRRQWSLYLGAFFMVMALYTKQTMIAAPLACIIALAITKPRRAVLFTGWLTLWGAIPLVALEAITGGEFLKNTLFYNMNTFSQADLKIWLNHVWQIHRWFSLAAAVGFLWLLCVMIVQGRKPLNPDDTPHQPLLHGYWQPLFFYGLLAQWNILGAAKAGSAENYLLEPIAAWTLLIALGGASALRTIVPVQPGGSRRTLQTASAAIVAIGMGFLILSHARILSSPFAQERLFTPYNNPSRVDFEAARIILDRTRKADTPLTELAIFPLQAGKNPVLQPFIMSELARQGRWNQDSFVQSVNSASFDVVIAQQDLTAMQAPIEYTEEMLKAFRSAYKLEETIRSQLWTYYIFVPKASTDSPATDNIAMGR